jgi:DNA polymerase I
LARELYIPVSQAESLLAAHATAYPGVAAWVAAVHQCAATAGEVRTLFGRRRYLPNINSERLGDANEARRHAVNTIIQGTAADLIKLAIIRLDQTLPVDVKMLLPVHDSVLLEVPEQRVEEVRQQVAEVMELSPSGFAIPMKVDVKVGSTWAECKQAGRVRQVAAVC